MSNAYRESKRLVIEIPMLPPKELSPNYRCHWGTQHRASKTAQKAAYYAAVAARNLHGAWVPPVIAHLDIVLVVATYRNKIDEHNVIARAKPFVDALKKASVIIDDSPEHLRLGSVRHEIASMLAPMTKLVLAKAGI